MRKLEDIMDDVLNDKMPTHEECYYALRVYRVMFNMDHRLLMNELTKPKDELGPDSLRWDQADISFERLKGALGQSPKKWLGLE